MVDIVVSIAAKVAEYLVAPVGRHCGYVIFPDSSVNQLRNEVEELENVRQGVQASIDHAENSMKPVKANVNKWVREVENGTSEASSVLVYAGIAKKNCFYGWLPNLKVRYLLGRKARRKAKHIRKLIDRNPFGNVYEDSPPGRIDGASDMISLVGDGGDTIFESRASILDDIMNALDNEKHKVIGIYGAGGVGKTKLLEVVEKKLRKEGRPIHMIVKSEVSRTPDLKNIQDDIAYGLGLNLKDEPSAVGRRDLLLKRLQKDPSEKVLVVLDDLWEKLDLTKIGIPSADESRGCQVLLTSRYKDVLQQKMRASPVFHLKGLKDDEAFGLFEKIVGDRLKDDEDLKEKARQVVKKLMGLPLLIISVASTLKDSEVHAWRSMLIKIDEPDVERIVKLSYNHLKSEDAKIIFLLCGLIGGTIQVELLLVLGMGLGLFERFYTKIRDSRDRLDTILDELRSACLLLDGGDDKDNVTIHDLYSEVVGSTPFRGNNSLMINSNYDSWAKEKLEKCWAICQVDVGRDRLDELMTCRFANLEILMLSQSVSWHSMPKHQPNVGDRPGLLDFTDMKDLRVLYLCSMHVTNLPSSIRILGNLQSLYLDRCNVEDVAILGNLKALQILSFAGSAISKLPEEIGELTNLKLLNLSNCSSLKIIMPNVLKGLTNLEELHMKKSFDQWMDEDKILLESCNARLAELKSLKKLTSLEISIPNPTILLEDGDLPFGNLIRFWINIGNVDGREFKGLRTMKLKLEGCDNILSKEWVQKALQKTQYLHLDGLRKFNKNPHELCPQLKHLYIQNSPSVKYIASLSNGAFTILESLFLKNLINLEKICHGHIAAKCFSKLKSVRVEECNRLKYLWHFSELEKLEQLEEIEVWKCDSMRAIVTIDARKKNIAPANYRFELPYVRRLDLAKLPNVASFCTGAEMTSEDTPIQAEVVDEGGGDEGTELITATSDLQDTYSGCFFDRKVILSNMEKLKLDSVGSFKRIWHDELSRIFFCKLAIVTLKRCSNLLHIFPSTIIGGLHNLESVEVEYCQSLKSLFDCGSLDSNTEQERELLPELVSIYVYNCPSLESLFNCGSFDPNVEHQIVLLPKLEGVKVSRATRLRHVVMSDSQTVFGFPSLKIVSVDNCSNLGYLFPNYTTKTLMELERLEITKCEQMKEVISDKEDGRSEAEVMSFHCLSELTLKELDNLISFSSGSCSYDFVSLKDLRIVGCCNFGAFIPNPANVKRPSGETVQEDEKLPPSLFNAMVMFPNIRELELEGVQCKELWNDQIPIDSFCKLESLNLKHCNNLLHIAPSHMWKRLQRCLKTLRVISCSSIKVIYENDGVDTEGGELQMLVLRDLKKLSHIWWSNSLPNIPFPNLRDVEAVRCSHLKMLFTTFTVKFLGQIEEMLVDSCEEMKQIAGDEKSDEACEEIKQIAGDEKSDEAIGKTITFSKLTALALSKLPRFERFLPEKYSFKFSCSKDFPSLRHLNIERCGKEPDRDHIDCERPQRRRRLPKFVRLEAWRAQWLD